MSFESLLAKEDRDYERRQRLAAAAPSPVQKTDAEVARLVQEQNARWQASQPKPKRRRRAAR